MRIDQQKERSQDEVDERDTDGQMVALGNKREGEGDNTNKRVLFTSVQTQNSTEKEDGEQRRSQKSRWKFSPRYVLLHLLPSSHASSRITEISKIENIAKCMRREHEMKTPREIKIFQSRYAQTRSDASTKSRRKKYLQDKRCTTRIFEAKIRQIENPWFPQCYNYEDNDKDEIDCKNASIYVQTKTSSPIGRPEHQRSYQEDRTERSQPRGWEDDKCDSEDGCDMRTNEDILYIVKYYMFSYFAE